MLQNRLLFAPRPDHLCFKSILFYVWFPLLSSSQDHLPVHGRSWRSLENTRTATLSESTSWKESTGYCSTGTTGNYYQTWSQYCMYRFLYIYSLADFLFAYQAELYPGRWDGSGEDHPVHHTALWDIRCWRPRPIPCDRSPFHHHKLGEGVLHLDQHERYRLPRQLGQPTDDPAVRDVLQGWKGGLLIGDDDLD